MLSALALIMLLLNGSRMFFVLLRFEALVVSVLCNYFIIISNELGFIIILSLRVLVSARGAALLAASLLNYGSDKCVL